jgi:hypothetical protein
MEEHAKDTLDQHEHLGCLIDSTLHVSLKPSSFSNSVSSLPFCSASISPSLIYPFLLTPTSSPDLREPDSVPIPDPTTPPIASLPLLDGYRCLHAECTNLCASVKRMRRHWADVHGSVGVGFLAMAREVKMQTFFRGTKIRYFEVGELNPERECRLDAVGTMLMDMFKVAPDLIDDGADEYEETEDEEQLDDGEMGQENQLSNAGEHANDSSVDELMSDVTTSTSTPPSSFLTPNPSPLAFDLKTLVRHHAPPAPPLQVTY